MPKDANEAVASQSECETPLSQIAGSGDNVIHAIQNAFERITPEQIGHWHSKSDKEAELPEYFRDEINMEYDLKKHPDGTQILRDLRTVYQIALQIEMAGKKLDSKTTLYFVRKALESLLTTSLPQQEDQFDFHAISSKDGGNPGYFTQEARLKNTDAFALAKFDLAALAREIHKLGLDKNWKERKNLRALLKTIASELMACAISNQESKQAFAIKRHLESQELGLPKEVSDAVYEELGKEISEFIRSKRFTRRKGQEEFSRMFTGGHPFLAWILVRPYLTYAQMKELGWTTFSYPIHVDHIQSLRTIWENTKNAEEVIAAWNEIKNQKEYAKYPDAAVYLIRVAFPNIRAPLFRQLAENLKKIWRETKDPIQVLRANQELSKRSFFYEIKNGQSKLWLPRIAYPREKTLQTISLNWNPKIVVNKKRPDGTFEHTISTEYQGKVGRLRAARELAIKKIHVEDPLFPSDPYYLTPEEKVILRRVEAYISTRLPILLEKFYGSKLLTEAYWENESRPLSDFTWEELQQTFQGGEGRIQLARITNIRYEALVKQIDSHFIPHSAEELGYEKSSRSLPVVEQLIRSQGDPEFLVQYGGYPGGAIRFSLGTGLRLPQLPYEAKQALGEGGRQWIGWNPTEDRNAINQRISWDKAPRYATLWRRHFNDPHHFPTNQELLELVHSIDLQNSSPQLLKGIRDFHYIEDRLYRNGKPNPLFVGEEGRTRYAVLHFLGNEDVAHQRADDLLSSKQMSDLAWPELPKRTPRQQSRDLDKFAKWTENGVIPLMGVDGSPDEFFSNPGGFIEYLRLQPDSSNRAADVIEFAKASLAPSEYSGLNWSLVENHLSPKERTTENPKTTWSEYQLDQAHRYLKFFFENGGKFPEFSSLPKDMRTEFFGEEDPNEPRTHRKGFSSRTQAFKKIRELAEYYGIRFQPPSRQ